MTFNTPVWATPTGHRMRAILARLELVSAGTTASWGSSGGENEHGPQSGDPQPEHVVYRNRFENAADEPGREVVIETATQALATLTGVASSQNRPAGETREQRDARIINEGAGWSVKDTARHCRCGEGDVVKARKAADRRIDDGKPRVDQPRKRGDIIPLAKLQDVERMAADGMTERQIAFSTGLPKSTIRRTLGRAA